MTKTNISYLSTKLVDIIQFHCHLPPAVLMNTVAEADDRIKIILKRAFADRAERFEKYLDESLVAKRRVAELEAVLVAIIATTHRPNPTDPKVIYVASGQQKQFFAAMEHAIGLVAAPVKIDQPNQPSAAPATGGNKEHTPCG